MEIIDARKESKDFVVNKICEVLEKGGLVINPSQSSYGAGVDATNSNAVDKLIEYKSNREGKPFTVVCSGKEMASRFVEINDLALNIYENYLPGPITVVSVAKKDCGIDRRVLSPSGTLGVYIPKVPILLEAAEKFGRPFTSTSANPSGKPMPYTLKTLFRYLSAKQKKLIDLVVDVGDLERNPPSTIIDTTVGEVSVLRRGNFDFNFKETFESFSEEETIEFARNFTLKKLDILSSRALVFALIGKMGAGKTRFAKGVGEALGLKRKEIKSPTYSIINEFDFELDILGEKKEGKFFHIDVWRISNEKELEVLELGKIVKKGNLVLIEWADRFFPEIERFIHISAIFWVKIEMDKKLPGCRLIKY